MGTAAAAVAAAGCGTPGGLSASRNEAPPGARHTIGSFARHSAAGLGCADSFPSFLGANVFISSAYAQAATGGDMQSSLMSMLPLVLMFVVLYFVMIRPQMKRSKEHRSMIDALAKGDEVATAGGVLGKVTKIGDVYLSLEIANGVEVQLQRSAVVQVLPKGSIK
jgi:preprotein translocase subunit YajC